MRLATVGTSWICGDFIEAAKASGEYDLVAVYSRNEETGRSFAERHGCSAVYTDIGCMAAQPNIDVVYIASPNSLHFEQALTFIKNKKHVICEKPVFSNIKEFDIAYTCAEEHGVFIFEAIRNVNDPNFEKLKSSLSRVGKIQNVILQFCQYSSKYQAYLDGKNPNIFSPEFSGGAIYDLGVYPINIAIGLWGMPKNYSYIARMLESGVDGAGTLVLEYEEFNCTIIFSKISAGAGVSEIQGVDGIITFSNLGSVSPLNFVDRKTGKSHSLEAFQNEKNMVYEAKNFAKRIQEGDVVAYAHAKKQSAEVLTIIECSRKKVGIIFGVEK